MHIVVVLHRIVTLHDVFEQVTSLVDAMDFAILISLSRQLSLVLGLCVDDLQLQVQM